MIYVECDPDEVLVKSLLTTRNQIKHNAGKSRVCAQLKNDSNCKGMIDEDPNSQPEPYLKDLQEVPINGSSNQNQVNLQVFHDNKRNNTLILLCPKMEEWILSACLHSGVSITSFNLPDTPDRLHDRLTLSRKHNMGDFQRLIEALLAQNSTALKMLRALLNE